jgi:hypothetical protein
MRFSRLPSWPRHWPTLKKSPLNSTMPLILPATALALRDGRLNSRYPALNSDLVKKRIDEAIGRYLSAKGLTQVASSPDLNVRYHFGSAPRTEVERYPRGWRGVDLHDTASRTLVWRSIAHEDKSDPEQAQRARLRTAKQRRNSLCLWAVRLTPCPSCASSSDRPASSMRW